MADSVITYGATGLCVYLFAVVIVALLLSAYLKKRRK